MDIGKKIKNLRLGKLLTQRELAKMLGVSKSTMSNYERNITTPSPDIFISLASYFDVSVDYFLNDKPDIPRDIIKEEAAYHVNKALSKDEWNAVSYYRRLSDEQKDFVKGQMIQLYQKSTSANKN
ncbi:helix-turn-helix domain-containing protein [Anaerocolumna xylanovorans]|uniref:Helix-turn-helix domain-containing protein n=1 Tax=Anaerocolumna xylanovorans DSM 12503 TaxID=1121345 RepID=A0A1M7YE36_9FIRM|nr:helix-turn-helix domain-containing protein [Anaerocolumna xylanovorans]SHO50895.1 Helix-turn-helix domain-containing protein [Anaerocolumna xylanovorans DSM 12503]